MHKGSGTTQGDDSREGSRVPVRRSTAPASAPPFVISLLLLLAALAAHADITKEATWTAASGGNGHTYRVVAKPGLISWDQANTEAQAAGGYLATITSAAENAFVFSLIDDPTFWRQSANGHGPWIGAYQPPGSPEPDGGWTWVARTGQTAPEDFAYSNWESGDRTI